MVVCSLLPANAFAAGEATLDETEGSTVVREGGFGDSYTVALRFPPTSAVTVSITDPSGQVLSTPSTLRFTPVNWSSPQKVEVSAIDDGDLEPTPHTAPLVHTASSSDSQYDEARLPTLTVFVLDNDDIQPPVSVFGTGNGQIYMPLLTPRIVSGHVTDNFAGVEQVTVTFTPAVGMTISTTATLFCNPSARQCSWQAPVPATPSRYLVRARGRDFAGNVETPGPTIYIYVV
ncbi:MAG TPA: hypothetical protein VM600_07295 [Actinomycetota bacterium]|nr:hypothetical protein [Actinomycetota bacterium]